MLRHTIRMLCRAAMLFTATASLAHAHHVMDYATPATGLEGLLSERVRSTATRLLKRSSAWSARRSSRISPG